MDFDREYKLYNTIQYKFIDIDWKEETCMVERFSNDITTYARGAFSRYYIWFVFKVSFWGHWIKVSIRFGIAMSVSDVFGSQVAWKITCHTWTTEGWEVCSTISWKRNLFDLQVWFAVDELNFH